MLTNFCVFHQDQFNSLTHKPVVLTTCPNVHCEDYLREQIETGGEYTCLICYKQVFALEINEQATNLVISAISEREVLCELHASRIGDFFCHIDSKVYCEECSHKAECCKRLGEELGLQIRFEISNASKEMNLPADIQFDIANMNRMTLKDRYRLLRRIAEAKSAALDRKCSVHTSISAEKIHRGTLKLACRKCVTAEEDNFLSLGEESKAELITSIRLFLRKTHCFALDLPLLQTISKLDSLPMDKVLSFSVELSAKAESKSMEIPREMVCPFDRNSFLQADGSYIDAADTHVAALSMKMDDLLTEEEYGPFVTEKIRQIPHWRGTKIPNPTLSGEDFKVLNRFFAVYPPENVPEQEIHPSMGAWGISQRVNQFEAVTLIVSSAVFLTGLTVACPVNRAIPMTVDKIQVRKGEFLSSPIYSDPLDDRTETCQGELVHDIRFLRSVPIDAHQSYTLSLRIRGSSGDLKVYKGNQITAKEFLMTEDVDLWVFQEPRKGDGRADLVTRGDNSKSGPILRLFYRKQ